MGIPMLAYINLLKPGEVCMECKRNDKYNNTNNFQVLHLMKDLVARSRTWNVKAGKTVIKLQIMILVSPSLPVRWSSIFMLSKAWSAKCVNGSL